MIAGMAHRTGLAIQPSTPPATVIAPVRAEPDDPVAFQLLNEIGIIDQLAQSSATKLLAPALNMSQFAVLNHFARLGGERSMVQLAGNLQVTKAAITNTVGRLRDKGLLNVQPDPHDGRGKVVTLTAEGRQARDRAVKVLAQALQRLHEAVPTEELTAALALLRRLRVWFDANR